MSLGAGRSADDREERQAAAVSHGGARPRLAIHGDAGARPCPITNLLDDGYDGSEDIKRSTARLHANRPRIAKPLLGIEAGEDEREFGVIEK